MQLRFQQILQAIADTKATLHQDITTVAVGLGLLRDDHKKLSEKVKKNETAIAEMALAQTEGMQKLKALTERVSVLERRAEDAEGRNRRNNVRVVVYRRG